MTLDETLFIGGPRRTKASFDLEEVLARHAAVREAITRTIHREVESSTDLWPMTCSLSLIYAFNSYKALGLVLAKLHYEAGAVLLRQLWEASLNLHWIEQDAEIRAQDFFNYTSIEFRKQLARRESGEFDQENRLGGPSLEEYDKFANRFHAKFFTRVGKRRRPQKSFAQLNAQDRARQVGEPWQREYGLLYDLTSHHAHGGPGAVLRPLFLQDEQARKAAEIDATALVALKSIDLIVRDVHLWAAAFDLDRPTEAEVVAAGFEPNQHPQEPGEGKSNS